MPRYRVNTKSFIANNLVEEGAEIEYDGIPGSNLDPLDKAAENAIRAARTKQPRGGKGEATLLRTGRDLNSPFSGSDEDGEGHRDEDPGNDRGVSNPQGRRADPQPEVGPTEAGVDPKAAKAAAAKARKAAEKGEELREGTVEEEDDGSDLG
jgi:hypothetical protein